MSRSYDLGILGGGQLARMLAHAAQRMGMSVLTLDPSPDACAGQVTALQQGELGDIDALREVFRRCNFVTLENEFVPADVLQAAMVAEGVDRARMTPSPTTLAFIQDKWRQREVLAQHGVPSPPAAPVADWSQAPLDGPMMLKARRGGYDGKGTFPARTPAQWADAQGQGFGDDWMAEAWVPFQEELAVMVVRDASQTLAYPAVRSEQVDQVCDLVEAVPQTAVHEQAQRVAMAAVEAVHGFGVFGVELFLTENGKVLVNEIAPRVHNSGHYTMDWPGASQFEQAVRVATGLTPSPGGEGEASMANLLAPDRDGGDLDSARRAALEAEPEARIHWYGKSVRKGRKVGHINVCGPDSAARARRARAAFWQAF